MTFKAIAFAVIQLGLVSATVQAAPPIGQKTCGLMGSIEEKINDCNTVKFAFDGVNSFTLVTSDQAGKEVWKDNQTGIIWFDREVQQMTWQVAANYCASHQLKLPSLEDFHIAHKENFEDVLPNFISRFFGDYWTESNTSGFPYEKIAFRVPIGVGFVYSLPDSVNFVRCVGRQ